MPIGSLDKQIISFLINDTTYQYDIINSGTLNTNTLFSSHVNAPVKVDVQFNGTDWELNSFKNLSYTNYTAPSIDPTSISGLVHWYRSDQLVTYDENGISSWDDLIGNANGIQTNNNNKPTFYSSSSLNGHPKIRFGEGTPIINQSTMDALNFSITLAQPYTIILVWQRWNDVGYNNNDGSTVHWSIIGSSTGDIALQEYTDVHTRWNCGANLTYSSYLNDAYDVGIDTFGVTTLIGNGTLSKIINNGTILATGDAGNAAFNGSTYALSLGSRGDVWGCSYIDAVEMCIFNKSLNDAEISVLQQNYFHVRYGI